MNQLIIQPLRRTLADDSGVTAIEYAFIAILVGMVCIVGWQLMGTNLSTTFYNLAASV